MRKAVPKNFTIFTGKHLCWSLFLIKLIIYYKETSLQLFSCEHSDIFKNNHFEKPLRTAAFENRS